MHQCVLGCLFDSDFKHVVLLQKKTGPLVLRDRWNFPGGKVNEPTENRWGRTIKEAPAAAVAREFGEETGLWLPRKQWTKLCTFTGNIESDYPDQFQVTAYWAVSDQVHTVKTTTKEPVAVFRLDTLPSPLAPQLPWVLEMAKDPTMRKKEWRVSA
jgi:8-oxo-dGTP pyrophosphatase MutT (NUDIX family)